MSMAAESPRTKRMSSGFTVDQAGCGPPFKPADCGPAAARIASRAGEVDHVQTSSVAGSAPNEMVTWLGSSPVATRVFQTRPVARSAACRLS